jgi:parallel beta-helix repeat protein
MRRDERRTATETWSGHVAPEVDMRRWCIGTAFIVLGGCGGGNSGGSSTVAMTVHPGESIQAAINAAPTHATIVVEPGVYHETPAGPTAITISKDGIALIGRSTPDHPVVLENAGGQKNGIVVAPADSVEVSEVEPPGEHPPCGTNSNLVHQFVLQGFTVRGFDQFGVYLACVDGFTLSDNSADANRLYSLFPVRSHNGTMSNNDVAHTSDDAALYVGQSDHVTITGNRAHDSLLGIEIENSSDITATKNQAFNNTLGIIADIMPGLQKMDQVDVMIADNDVHDNNLPNTAEGESTGLAPSGTGVVVLGGSMVTVQNNRIGNNGFAGIIVASFCSGGSAPCTGLDIDPDPEGNRILNNELTNNGTAPPADPILAALAADLIWDKTGMGNCWSGNTPTATTKILGGGRQLPACS